MMFRVKRGFFRPLLPGLVEQLASGICKDRLKHKKAWINQSAEGMLSKLRENPLKFIPCQTPPFQRRDF